MRIKNLFFSVLLAAVSIAPVIADELDGGISAYKRQDYKAALRLFKKAAHKGDDAAQFNLGLMYAQGQGVPQDYAEAVRWYRLAVQQGHAGAQVNLGLAYERGQGVPQDYAEAVRWYRLAAQQGHAKAQGNLGLMYAKGQGVPQDIVKAYLWFNLASVSGDASSIKSRDVVAENMSQQQIADAQKMESDCALNNLEDCD